MKRTHLFCVALGTAISLSACVKEADILALQAQIDRQNEQIRSLSQIQPVQADTWAQVQQLHQEMTVIQGEMDNFNHAAKTAGGLDKMLERLNRHEEALTLIGNEFALDLKLDNKTAPQNQANSTGYSEQNTAYTSASLEKPDKQNPATQSLSAGSSENKASSGTKTPDTTKNIKDTAQLLYDTGVDNFYNRKYQASLKAFDDFIKTYPKHNRIGHAYFWHGESNFALGRYPAAVLDYEKVISTYPKNPKIPSCYLKQGIGFSRMNNKQAAKLRLNELIKKFPKSPEATRAKNALKDLK